jgi:YD repeat-containing protein
MNVMKKYLITVFILIVTGCFKIYSQTNGNFLNRTPDFLKIATPNVASFDKFIDNPVSLYNGSIDVNIPIYTLKDNAIELPVMLRYNTSGIKVSEEASWVGLGWNLNVGGVISQNVVGDNDDVDVNYNTIINKLGITTVYNPYYAFQGSTDWVKQFDQYIGSGNIGHSGRLNPDVFYYSYPGGSGKFIFDYRNDSIYILDRKSDEKIEVFVKNNSAIPSLQEFRITTVDGSQHYFRYFTRMYSSAMTLTTSVSYVLYKSIYPNAQQVDYTYTSKPIRRINRSDVFQATLSTIEDYCDLSGYPYDYPTECALEGAEFYLSSVQTTNYQINFETSDRSDLMNGLKLNKIKIYPKNSITDASKIKEFVFDYDYFKANTNTGWKPDAWSTTGMVFTENQNLQRLKLLAVYEQNGTNKINKYDFTYDPTILPSKTSYAVDYWGNFNGQNGSSYLPDLKRLLWGDILANYDRAIKISEKYTFGTLYTNRGYDYNSCKAGILTKITYPTGGTKEIIYEPNTFTYATELPAAKDDINTITMTNYSLSLSDYNQASNGKSQVFTVTENRTGKLEILLSRGQHTGTYADGYFWWSLKGSKVTVISQPGSNTPYLNFIYDLTDDCHAKGNNLSFNNSDPGALKITINIPTKLTPGTYILNVNMTDNIPDQSVDKGDHQAFAYLNATLSLYLDGSTPLTPKEVKGCGIRVAQVINDFGNNNKTTTFFEYGNGILHDILQYYKVYDNIWLRYASSCLISDDKGQQTALMVRKKEVVEVFGNNTMSNPYASIGGVGYGYVKETTKSNGSNQGWIISEFSNKIPYTTQESVRVDDPLDGKLLKTSFYSNNNTVKKEVKYDYSYNILHRYFGINFRKNINSFTNAFATSGVNFLNPDLGDSFYASKAFTIIAHPLNANNILLNSITTTMDNVTVIESYTYNSTTLQQISKKISKSDGSNLEYKYFYPNDYAFAPYTNMTSAHVLSPVIEEKILNNNKYIGGNLTKYKIATQGSQTIYVPDKKYFSTLSAPLVTVPTIFSSAGENTTVYPLANVKYENQTAYGKPQSITYNDADRIVYLWGYNYQYPIAEIKNATQAEVNAFMNSVFGVTTTDALAALAIPNETKLKDGSLHKALPNALVTTYTYKRLIGISTVTAPNGTITYYDYDPFGRLKETYLMDGSTKKTLQTYTYNYQNQ